MKIIIKMHTTTTPGAVSDNGLANSHSQKDTEDTEENKSEALRQKLCGWINKQMRIEMTDGRILIGIFLCTDRDGNVILGSCSEYLNPEVCGFSDDPRVLGLVMVPGRHIVTIHYDVHMYEREA